jgi:S1-C subfamily serine protease
LAPCPPDSLRTEAQRLARVSAATLDSARPQRSAGSRGGATVGRGTAVGGGAGAGTGSAVGGGIAAGAAAPDIITSNVELRNYGFSLSCRPDCTRIRARTGIAYWKFDGYPTVAVQTLVKDGIAAKAGIREGDVLITVNGLSPLSEEGAVLLNRSDRELELTLEFSRAGKHEKYVLKL